MTAVDLPVVRGDSLTWTITLTITIDGTPVTDLATWTKLLQVRTQSTAPVVAVTPTLLSTAGMVLTYGLTATQTAALSHAEYVWDLQLTNPGPASGYGVMTWPPASEDRNTMTVTGDVSRSA